MKIFKITLFAICFLQNTTFAQNSVVEQLQGMRQEAARQSEESTADIQRLQGELTRLGQRLAETNQRLTTVQNQALPTQLTTPVTLEEIARHFENKNFGPCTITPGEHHGEYFIKRNDDKIKIRFIFLSKDEALGPKASLTKSGQGEDLLQIFQPGYDPDAINNEGAMTATVRFRLVGQGTGEVNLAVFTGQRVEDQFGWMGLRDKNSYAIDTVVCISR